MKRTGLLLTMLGACFLATGCSDEGPAEEAGEKIDQAMEDTGEAVDDAADDLGDAVDDAADNLEDAADDLVDD